MHSISASIYLEVELENALEETSVIRLELEKEFGGTGPHLEVELEKCSNYYGRYCTNIDVYVRYIMYSTRNIH